jgi:hypothetical protein
MKKTSDKERYSLPIGKDKTIDFLKVVESIKENETAEKKEAFKQLRFFYLELLEAGFTMEEAMAFLAFLVRGNQ